MSTDNQRKAEMMLALVMEYAKVFYPDDPQSGAIDVVNKLNRGEGSMDKKLRDFMKDKFEDYIKGGNDFEL